jgi:hypothetical protein
MGGLIAIPPAAGSGLRIGIRSAGGDFIALYVDHREGRMYNKSPVARQIATLLLDRSDRDILRLASFGSAVSCLLNVR